jgi:RNA polymerase sigma-70 factor (ECF subfamily)
MPDELADQVSPATDSDVEARFAAGDIAAFEALFRAWQAEVFRWVVRIVRDRAAAEDVTAEAFWRAYRSRARFDPARSFGAWMRRIATNAALDHLRRARAEAGRIADAAQVAAIASGPSREVDDAVTAAVRHLSPTLRVVVTLALVEDQPYAEIADALGISIAAVKVRVFRAVRALRYDLERRGVRP